VRESNEGFDKAASLTPRQRSPMAARKRTRKAKRRGRGVLFALAAMLSVLSIWVLWRTTRPPEEQPVRLPAPLGGGVADAPSESIDAAERARLDALLKQRAGGSSDASRSAR